ncbi:protein Sfi1p [Monosporozyma servazzii]
MPKVDLFMNGVKEVNGHRDRRGPPELYDGEMSTIELLDQGPVQLSTEMLLNQPARELLLHESHLPVTHEKEIAGMENNIEEELADFNNIKLSDDAPIINEYNISTPDNKFKPTPGRRNYDIAASPDNYNSDETLLNVLPKLYNKIQVYLLNNEYSLHFLKRFKAYVGYLITFGLLPFADENVLKVHDCVMGNVPLVDEMEFMIKKFLFKPDNLIMKLVDFEFSKNNTMLQMQFSLWKIRLVTENGLKLYEKFLKAKFLRRWLTSYEKYGIYYKEQSDDINQTRLKEFAFDKLMIADDTLRRMDIVADSKLKQSFFLRFKRFFSTLKESEAILEQRQDDIVRKLYMKKWILQYKSSTYQPDNIMMKERILKKWRHGYKARQKMVDEALWTRYIYVSKATMGIWKNKLDKQNQINNSLVILKDKFVKRKYLNKLSSSYRNSQIVEEATVHLDNVLKSFILQKMWYKRFQERLHLYSFESITHERVQRKYLHKMTKEFYFEIKADQFRQDHDQEYFWNIWKKRSILQGKLNTFKNNNFNKNFFQDWNHQTCLRLKYKDAVFKKLASKYFYKWEGKNRAILKSDKKAQLLYKNTIRKKYFSKLKQKFLDVTKLKQAVDLHIKAKTINRLKNHLITIKELQTREEQQYPFIIRRIIQTNYIYKWKKLYTAIRDEKINQCFCIYSNQRDNRLKGKYFQIYHKQSLIINQHLNYIADDMNKRQLKKLCLNKAFEAFDRNQDDYIYADTVKNITILKDVFAQWKFRVNELDAILQEVTNEKNLYLLSTYLKMWSMNHFKIARNERTVQLFRQRWERATLRGLVQLWKMKIARAKQSNSEPLDEIENGDAVFDRDEVNSTITNISPHHIEGIATPKRQEGSDMIPGSLRMRRYKMQETISRYNRAKIIPSPLKESSTLPNTVKRRLQPKNSISPIRSPVAQGMPDGSPRKLQFSIKTSLKPPSQSRTVKHRSQSVLNGSPERRPPLNIFPRTTDNLT